MRATIRETQNRFGINIRALAVMSNHIHLVIRVRSRAEFANALRFLAGQIAFKVARGKLWASRAWSRPLKFGRDARAAELYVWRNTLKAGIFVFEDGVLLIGEILQV